MRRPGAVSPEAFSAFADVGAPLAPPPPVRAARVAVLVAMPAGAAAPPLAGRAEGALTTSAGKDRACADTPRPEGGAGLGEYVLGTVEVPWAGTDVR